MSLILIRGKKMKTLIVTGLLILSQLSYAVEVKRMSVAEARARVEQSKTYKDIVAAREAGRDITADPKLMERISKVLDMSLNEVVSLSSTESNNLVKLLTINTRDVMTEVARLSSVAKDPSSNAQEREMARKSIELIAKAAHTVDAMAVNDAQAQIQKDKVAKIIEISGKISALDFGQASKSFVEKYERALTEGKSVEESIRVASNGKFTEKELRECE